MLTEVLTEWISRLFPSVTWTQTKISWEGKTPSSRVTWSRRPLPFCPLFIWAKPFWTQSFRNMLSHSPSSEIHQSRQFFFSILFFQGPSLEMSEGSPVQLGEMEFSLSCSLDWKKWHSDLSCSVSLQKNLAPGYPERFFNPTFLRPTFFGLDENCGGADASSSITLLLSKKCNQGCLLMMPEGLKFYISVPTLIKLLYKINCGRKTMGH